MKIFLTVVILVVVVIIGGVFLFDIGREPIVEPIVNSFDECAELYPVMESYPRRCMTPAGVSFTEVIGSEEATTTAAYELTKPLRLTNLVPQQSIQSPYVLKGEAPGPWYFEASFPISILNEKGVKLGTVVAEADGEWMTESYVPFTATLVFDSGTSTAGSLLLEKDNPSGLPEHARSVTVPIRFEISN
jgi:hypothetical protein